MRIPIGAFILSALTGTLVAACAGAGDEDCCATVAYTRNERGN